MRATLLVGLMLAALAATPAGAAGTPAAQPAAAQATAADNAAGWTTSGPNEAQLVPGTNALADGDACAPVAGGAQREHPDEDRLGWENGCWHDDPLAITVEDGLNESELDAVVARTMARIEYVRELEFDHTVPVDVISRATFRNQTDERFANLSTAERLHQNVKHEAVFFVPEDEDAVAQLATNQGGTILGYYSPSNDRIVIVSDSDGPLQVDGPTLAHELAHALQDQHFNLSRYERRTTEENNAVSGLLEGDPTYTEYLYEQRCGEAWTCPSQDTDSGGSPGDEFDWGIYLMGFQPYSDGGSFVQQLREQGGWAAVNAAYENPPASSEQVMYPQKYPEETPANVTIADRSDDEWRVLDLENGVDYAEYGEPGMASMFISPTYDDRDPVFVTQRDVLTGEDLDPLQYSIPPTDGWNGDRLYPYVRNDSATTNETGYVWKTKWDSEADAREFAAAYVELLQYHGAEPVTSHTDTYRIPDEEPYGDAFYVNHTAATVVIVNAPTVDDLSGVRAGAAPEAPPTPTATQTRVGTPATDEPSADDPPADGDGTSEGPITTTNGFEVAVALLALLAAALLARRR